MHKQCDTIQIRKPSLLLYLLLMVILLPALLASADSDSYSVDSFTESVSGGDISGSNYQGDYAFIYQQGIGNASGDSYSAEYTLTSTVSQEEEETTTETPATGGGGCTYDWICTEWYPEPCPQNGIQKRLCVNKGTCSGTTNIPESGRDCVYVEPIGPLFYFFSNIPMSHKVIAAGSTLKAELELINVGDIETLDVFFKYWIVNENNSLLAEMQETRAVTQGKRFAAYISMPKSAPPGTYRLFIQITYDDGKVAVAEDSFEVVSRRLYILYALGALLLIIILIILILYLKKKGRVIKSIPKKKKEKSLIDYKKRIRKGIEKHKNKSSHKR